MQPTCFRFRNERESGPREGSTRDGIEEGVLILGLSVCCSLLHYLVGSRGQQRLSLRHILFSAEEEFTRGHRPFLPRLGGSAQVIDVPESPAEPVLAVPDLPR